MAKHEVFDIHLYSGVIPSREHTPIVYGLLAVQSEVSVDASRVGFEHSSGLIIDAAKRGYTKSGWYKVGTGHRTMQYGFAALITKAGISAVGGELANEDKQLLDTLNAAPESASWLALYGYREQYMNAEVVGLPVYKGRVYVGDDPGEVPEELEYPLKENRDHAPFYKSLRDALTVIETPGQVA